MTRVLIIDDDADMTEVLRITLLKAGFQVLVANESQAGIRIARDHNPDVIVLDVMMPEMDGLEVCEQIRTFCQIPILILSVINRPALIAESLDRGADDYLTKPVTNSVLIAHINNLARRSLPLHGKLISHQTSDAA